MGFMCGRLGVGMVCNSEGKGVTKKGAKEGIEVKGQEEHTAGLAWVTAHPISTGGNNSHIRIRLAQ